MQICWNFTFSFKLNYTNLIFLRTSIFILVVFVSVFGLSATCLGFGNVEVGEVIFIGGIL